MAASSYPATTPPKASRGKAALPSLAWLAVYVAKQALRKAATLQANRSCRCNRFASDDAKDEEPPSSVSVSFFPLAILGPIKHSRLIGCIHAVYSHVLEFSSVESLASPCNLAESTFSIQLQCHIYSMLGQSRNLQNKHTVRTCNPTANTHSLIHNCKQDTAFILLSYPRRRCYIPHSTIIRIPTHPVHKLPNKQVHLISQQRSVDDRLQWVRS